MISSPSNSFCFSPLHYHLNHIQMSVEAGRKDPEGDRLLLLEWNNIEDITCSLVGFLVTKLL